ncbi:MAG: hypothetical protein HYY62_01470 [Deltaproteobacteria bacterium]|nr:hypothetical protein [Deltaproteobacteria bacterium]
MKYKLFLILLLIPAFAGMTYAQEATPPSVFDEGVDTTIKPEDIGDDVRQWAQNTALKLKEVLKQTKRLSYPERRRTLIQTVQSAVEEARDTKELLLMRFTLNRALKLETLFQNQPDSLALNYILLPAMKQAITLYENADLPYLEANKGKPEGEIGPPPSAALAKANIGYLLTASTMNKTHLGQFEILKLSIAWMANDLLRSPEAKRNPANARIILNLQVLEESLKNITPSEITYTLLNMIRSTLLESAQHIVSETNARIAPALAPAPIPNPPPPPPVKETSSSSNQLSILANNLGSRKWEARRDTVRLIGKIQSQKATTLLINTIGDSDQDVRNATMDELAKRTLANDDLSTIKPFLSHHAWEIRHNAVRLLRKINTPESTSLVIPRLDDSDSDIRALAKSILNTRIKQ